MLEESIKNDIRRLYTELTEGGYSLRQAQKVMIGHVATTMGRIPNDGEEHAGAPILVVEGKTGTGKTTGYMLGTIPVAMARGKKVVISTATVALQEQLFNRDIPALQATCSLKFDAALAKGRGRFACPSRLVARCGDNQMGLDGFGSTDTTDDDNVDLFLNMLHRFDTEQWSGDLDEWETYLDGSTRKQITTDSRSCAGKACGHYNKCPFYKARKQVFDADVIVANHDLVLSAYIYGSGAIPAAEDSVLIFDEGHHLTSKALSRAAETVNLHAAGEAAEALEKFAQKALVLVPAQVRSGKESLFDVGRAQALLNIHRNIVALVKNAKQLNTEPKHGSEARLRFKNGRVPDSLLPLAKDAEKETLHLYTRGEALHEFLFETLKDNRLDRKAFTPILTELGELLGRLESYAQCWADFCTIDAEGVAPMARWVSRRFDQRNIDYTFATSPIRADFMLNDLLWSKCAGAIVTSATITSLGRFDHFSEQAGLRSAHADVSYLDLPSPFDYEQNAVMSIPRLRCNPSKQDEHTQAVIEWCRSELQADIGTLMLFSSYRQMQQVYESLRPDMAEIALMQGQMSRKELLETHRERRLKGQGSLIMGVASLSEGIDLPGDLLNHLVIAKLPFIVPDSPVYEATSEWLESMGRNPFMELAVPDASLKLTQAVGRLIRTETDTGRVTILDHRLIQKRYGKQMLAALPPMRREFGGMAA